jgi:hypothetical protein
LRCERDHASAIVILTRGLAGKRADSHADGGSADQQLVAVGETPPVEACTLQLDEPSKRLPK